jgi:hypothetical protein
MEDEVQMKKENSRQCCRGKINGVGTSEANTRELYEPMFRRKLLRYPASLTVASLSLS